MGEHDCETIARAHLVSLRWASGPSSLRSEPPRYRLRRIALRATGRGQAFSRLFVVHRTTFAEGDARGGSERSDSPLCPSYFVRSIALWARLCDEFRRLLYAQ